MLFMKGDKFDNHPTIYDDKKGTTNLSALQSSHFPRKVLKQLVLQ